MEGPDPWSEAVAAHAAAVASFARAAEQVPGGRWAEPLGPGKWAPGQVVVHLTLAYDALLRELSGGAPMRLRTAGWQRLLLRFTIRHRVLAGTYFPTGVRAPREARPPEEVPERAAAVARLREQAEAFVAALEEARRGRRVVLTHPYFGGMDDVEGLRFCAAHLRHHQAQLPEPV